MENIVTFVSLLILTKQEKKSWFNILVVVSLYTIF